MSRTKKSIYGPDIYTEKGVKKAAEQLAITLNEHYQSLRKNMFKWRDESGKCENMFLESHDTAPEHLLINHNLISFFTLNGEDVHALPVNMKDIKLNMYGKISNWTVISPVPEINTILIDTPLNLETAVLCYDTNTHSSDTMFIHNIVAGMVDILITMRQRALLNRRPFVFSEGSEEDEPSDGLIGQFWNSFLSCKPFISLPKDAFDVQVFKLDTNVDMGITDYFNFLDCLLLTHLGYDATDIHKRAQQSVPETLMSQDKIIAYRNEKTVLRQTACDRCNEMFGTELIVECVPDKVRPVTSVLEDQFDGEDESEEIESDE